MTTNVPLAERMRPKTLADYIGQEHLIAPGTALRSMIERKQIPSMILWGPPGVGKTSLAEIIAHTAEIPFYTLSATSSGVKEVRQVIERMQSAGSNLFASPHRPILFIDEIHRFSKNQQDSLLAAVERGVFTLIGATTENPGFEVIRPLISRCQVYVLKPLQDEHIIQLTKRAIENDAQLKAKHCELQETEALIHYAGGDARKLLNILDLLLSSETEDRLIITNERVQKSIQANPTAFDKGGDLHYDIASALIKSIRGSDPDAAIYWLARLIAGGEDPKFIARRLIISAAEDIGLANPNALLLAVSAAEAVERIGWPEGRIPLAEATIYLATAEKSNSAYTAIDKALDYVQQSGNLPVPLHLRNASNQVMQQLGYGQGYKYAHDFPGHYVSQQYLPDAAIREKFWQGQKHTAMEARIAERIEQLQTRQHEEER
ncbi:Replication-associated recombination protein A [Porphyromonas crevioricanis]|uniref:Replication-associated recombination protein A n=1 Tax=Porphyromonas crevioricanis TaxID=393921 RepID=A0A2X4PPX3_9PORP|nr:replication-associated recombination protein A [Porphyromonas crevioricanis]GAD07230.1 ATPase, AAA family [Porphyromonas crevioricanis JCM 13913]SQH73993.1 Replication-associated recombination protein A [Porphyromonas crevioricanis]